MRIGTRQFRPDAAEWLKGGLESGGCTRCSLATELCERENWRNPLGAPCFASAWTAPPKLAAKQGLALPEALPMAAATAASRAVPPDYPDLDLDCALGDLGPVAVVLVDDCDKHLALDDGDAPSGGRRGVPRAGGSATGSPPSATARSAA